MSKPETTTQIGKPLTWDRALPLVRALRDIAQQSTDATAADVAAEALREVFPHSAEGLGILFERVKL